MLSSFRCAQRKRDDFGLHTDDDDVIVTRGTVLELGGVRGSESSQ